MSQCLFKGSYELLVCFVRVGRLYGLTRGSRVLVMCAAFLAKRRILRLSDSKAAGRIRGITFFSTFIPRTYTF